MIDGGAILIAVAIVSGVGSVVDWQKEKEFVKQTLVQDKGKIVSYISSVQLRSYSLWAVINLSGIRQFYFSESHKSYYIVYCLA